MTKTFVLLLSFSALGDLSLQEQTGWSSEDIVNVKCPESDGGSSEACSIACESHGANNTLGFYDTFCFKKLKAKTPLLISRDSRYGTGGGRISYRDGLDDIYHLKNGFMWGLELASPVDLSHWERITRATLYVDDIDTGMGVVGGGERNIISQSPIRVYRAQVQTPHYKNNQGRNNYMRGVYDNNAYVVNVNLAHPDYEAIGWDSTENVYRALNLTRFIRGEGESRGDLGPGLVIHQPSFEKLQGDDQMALTSRGSAAVLYLDIREEIWVMADTHCRSLFTCGECRAAKHCVWCFTSNLKNLCSDHCDDLWNNNESCDAASDSQDFTTTQEAEETSTTVTVATSTLTESFSSSDAL